MMERAQLSFDNKDRLNATNDILGFGSKPKFQLTTSLMTPGSQSFRSNSTIMKRGPDSAYSLGDSKFRDANLMGIDDLHRDKDGGEDDEDSHIPNIIRNEDSRDYYDNDEDSYDIKKLGTSHMNEELKESEKLSHLNPKKRYRVPA